MNTPKPASTASTTPSKLTPAAYSASTGPVRKPAPRFSPLPLTSPSTPPRRLSNTIFQKAVHDMNKSGDHAVELKALHAKIDNLGKKVGHYEKLLEQMEMKNKQCSDFKPSKTPDSDLNSVASQKPEDGIRWGHITMLTKQPMIWLILPGVTVVEIL
ncbi:hypothetical protein TIFTF001_049760 [Ficus carica]|uniref:Uncharacterized protein n=1 Tax=Ficus carica TaxID=3494 RepID=A0AA87ZFN2_FICCA|nr:hypothetical protein TIFTF001_049760 [Ficus carica]